MAGSSDEYPKVASVNEDCYFQMERPPTSVP